MLKQDFGFINSFFPIMSFFCQNPAKIRIKLLCRLVVLPDQRGDRLMHLPGFRSVCQICCITNKPPKSKY